VEEVHAASIKMTGGHITVRHLYLDIAVAIYLVLGLLGYSSIGGIGAELDPVKKPSRVRRVLVILLWPLAMIGVIEG
jgi:hypothetical protein